MCRKEAEDKQEMGPDYQTLRSPSGSQPYVSTTSRVPDIQSHKRMGDTKPQHRQLGSVWTEHEAGEGQAQCSAPGLCSVYGVLWKSLLAASLNNSFSKFTDVSFLFGAVMGSPGELGRKAFERENSGCIFMNKSPRADCSSAFILRLLCTGVLCGLWKW